METNSPQKSKSPGSHSVCGQMMCDSGTIHIEEQITNALEQYLGSHKHELCFIGAQFEEIRRHLETMGGGGVIRLKSYPKGGREFLN